MATAVPSASAPPPSASPSPEPTAAPVHSVDFELDVQIGYDGLILMNQWTPTFVTVTNHGADFDGLLGVNVFYSLTEYDRYEIPLTLASGATKRVTLPIKPQVRQDMYAFELVAGGTIVAERRVLPTRLIAPESMAVAVLSQDAERLTYLNQRANSVNTLRGEVWVTVPMTEESFPDTLDLLSSFSILVVDGVDLRAFSAQQQEALRAWIAKGGFVLVSGGAKAAESYPFFADWTQVTASTPHEGEDITPGLLAYAGLRGTALEEPVWLSVLPQGGALVTAEDGQGVLNMYRAGEGLIYLSAFDMGDKALSGWGTMTSFWPRMLRQSAADKYQASLNRAESARYGGNDLYRANELLGTLTVKNTESGVPVLLLLGAYLLVVGFGGYLILKKLDRREWLWIAAPLCAVVFALLIVVLGQGATMNKPVALTASRVLLDGDSAGVNTYIGVATSEGGEMMIETDRQRMVTVLTDSYWYDDSTGNADKFYRPVTLRQRYRFGSNPAVGFTASSAWRLRMLRLSEQEEAQIGRLDMSLWMEADGMHGEITNNTEHVLRGGLVVTAFGYSDVGDLLPGATSAFEMLYTDEPLDPSGYDYEIKPNVMYATLDVDPQSMTSGYYDSGVYTYLNAAIYGSGESQRYEDPIARQRNALVQMFEEDWSFYQSRDQFYYFGFTDTIGQVGVSLNGRPVTRTAHTGVVGSRIIFEPIGPTGIVMFPQGIIKAEVVVDMGEDEKPRLPTEEDGDSNGNNNYGSADTYLYFGSPVSIRYVLPDVERYTIEKMTLAGVSYESVPTMYLYNNDTGSWDEQLLLTVSMPGHGWEPYIDEEGAIYVRYIPAETAGRYEGMTMPSIALKGEVK